MPMLPSPPADSPTHVLSEAVADSPLPVPETPPGKKPRKLPPSPCNIEHLSSHFSYRFSISSISTTTPDTHQGRGGDVLTCGDVEANPGPAQPAPCATRLLWVTIDQLLTALHLHNWFRAEEQYPPDRGPSGEPHHPQTMYTLVTCEACSAAIYSHPHNLRPLVAHIRECHLLHTATGRGAALLTCGDIEGNPGPSPGWVSSFTFTVPFHALHSVASAPNFTSCHQYDQIYTATNHRHGRGRDLLSCGDIESNPGPPKGDPTTMDVEDTHSGTPEAVSDTQMAEPSQSSPCETCPRFHCPLQCGHPSWATRASVVNHVAHVHLPSLEDIS